jgi:hypothetical protein
MADATEDKKPKRIKLITPVGTSKYPYLNSPKTKFKENGEFTVDMVFTPEELAVPVKLPDGTKGLLIDYLTQLSDEYYNEWFNTAKPAERKQFRRYFPFGPELDEEGEETGNTVIKLGSPAMVKDKKTQQLKPWVPKYADKFGQVVKAEEAPAIFGGSKLRIEFSPSGFATKVGGVGLHLYLQSVQIVKLSTYTAAGPGFDAVDGYDDDEEEDDNSQAPMNTGEGKPSNGEQGDF